MGIMIKSHWKRVSVGLLIFAGAAVPLPGPLVDGTFSNGLTGWNIAGYAAAVGAQGNVTPVGSSFQALIASGSGCESEDPPHAAAVAKKARHLSPKSAKPKFECGSIDVADVPEATLEADLGLPAGAIHTALPNNYPPTDGSAIWQTFSATAGTSVTFYWNFATDEVVPTQWDAALYSFQVGSNPAQVFELADTTQSTKLNQNIGASPYFVVMTGYKQVTIPITTTGTYTIGFIAMQTGDDEVASGTYISSVVSGTSTTPSTTPIPASWTLALTGLAFVTLVLAFRQRALDRQS